MEVHTAPDLSPLAAEWAQTARPRPASCFQSFDFAQCWAAIYNGQSHLLIFHSADPAFVLPMAVRNGRLSVLGHGLFDYTDLIAAPAAATAMRAQAPEIAAALASVPGWKRMDICAVPGDSPFLDFWRALGARLIRTGPEPAFSRYSAAPLLILGGDTATTSDLDRLHSRAASRLQRAQRVSWLGAVREAGPRRRLLAWMLEQKERRLRDQGQSNVIQAAEADWLTKIVAQDVYGAELWAYYHDGHPMAGFLTFLTARTRYGYLLAFDPAKARHSPAIELLYFVLRLTVAEGREFDFLTGEQPYKLRFANAARPLLRLEVPRPEAAVVA